MLNTITAIAEDANGEIDGLRDRYGSNDARATNAGMRAIAKGIVAAGQMIALATNQSHR